MAHGCSARHGPLNRLQPCRPLEGPPGLASTYSSNVVIKQSLGGNVCNQFLTESHQRSPSYGRFAIASRSYQAGGGAAVRVEPSTHLAAQSNRTNR